MWSSLKKALIPAMFGTALMAAPVSATTVLDPYVSPTFLSNTLVPVEDYRYNPADFGAGETVALLFKFVVSPASLGTTTTASVLNPDGSLDFGIGSLTLTWLNSAMSPIKSQTFTDGSGLLNIFASLSLTVYDAFEPYYLAVAGLALDAGGHLELRLTTGPAGAAPVPIPPAAILFGSALVGLALLKRRRSKRATEFTAA